MVIFDTTLHVYVYAKGDLTKSRNHGLDGVSSIGRRFGWTELKKIFLNPQYRGRKDNVMKNTINLQINNATYNAVPVEVAKAIETMLAQYKTVAKTVETPKSEPKAKAKAEPKQYAKVYAVAKDGKSVTIGNDGFIPTKVFKGVTYSLKQAGAKYDAKTKAWAFETKKSCTEWCKAQDARG